MQYVSQIMSFTSYKNGDDGRGITEEISLYYAKASDNGVPEIPDTPDPESNDLRGWQETIPDNWKVIKEKFGGEVYVFETKEQLWNDGSKTYTTPTLLSRIEAATRAARASGKSIADWCALNNVTIVDGSTIATGSVTAKQLSADAIKSNNYEVDGTIEAPSANPPYSDEGTFLDLADGAIYSRRFAVDGNGNAYFNGTLSANALKSGVAEIGDLSALEATIAGWDIDENDIFKGSIGMSSGNTSYTSLISGNSPIRFYAGGQDKSSANFKVLEDGSLYASNAKIQGNVETDMGHIGNLTISPEGLWVTETTNYKSATDFMMTNNPYYIYNTGNGYMFSNVNHTDKTRILYSDYTYRFNGILENVPEIVFSGASNFYDLAIKGVGVWTIDKGIYEATFDKFFYARGDSTQVLTIDTSDITSPFYIGVFCSHEPESDIMLTWQEVAVRLTQEGFEGRVIPRQSTSSKLRALYIDEYGRICIKPE